jgi:hypothetical protein
VQVYGFFMYAHRLSLVLCGRDVPSGRKDVIMHTCDNPSCVNPAHLKIGTQKENMHDMIAKGRQHFPGCGGLNGERNPAAKLTAEKVMAMQDARGEGLSCRQMAERFGVSKTQAHRVLSGKSWKRAIAEHVRREILDKVPHA